MTLKQNEEYIQENYILIVILGYYL